MVNSPAVLVTPTDPKEVKLILLKSSATTVVAAEDSTRCIVLGFAPVAPELSSNLKATPVTVPETEEVKYMKNR